MLALSEQRCYRSEWETIRIKYFGGFTRPSSTSPLSSLGHRADWEMYHLTDRKMVSYNSKRVPILAINDLPEEPKYRDDKCPDLNSYEGKTFPATCMRGDANKNTARTRNSCVSCKRLKWASTDKVSATMGQYSCIDDIHGHFQAFLNWPFNMIVSNLSNDPRPFAEQYRIATISAPSSAIV